MFNDSWIYLQHEKRLYSERVENRIYFFIESTAETEKVSVTYSIAVWDENGIQLAQKKNTDTYIGSTGYGIEVDNIPEGHTCVTCMLQIEHWNVTSISRAQG